MKKINSLFEFDDDVWVIHYASSNFEDYPIRIGSIVLRRLTNNQIYSFSMNNEERDDNKEKQILEDFFKHIKSNPSAKYLHWNMRGNSYGFAVIQNRFKDLFPNNGMPFIVSDKEKYDLSYILVEIYGDSYIDHPRLKTLIEKNSLNAKYFLEGKAEAEAFENQEFSKIGLSMECKVNNLADIANLAHKKQLKTNNIRISDSSIQILASIITGDNQEIGHNYRAGSKLVDFFKQFDFSNVSSTGFLSRAPYAKEKLQEYNDTDTMSNIIKQTLHFIHFSEKKSYDNAITTLQAHLLKDGYQLLVPEGGQGDVSISSISDNRTVSAGNFKKLEHEFIDVQVSKANERLSKSDYDGAITTARTLVEEFCKQIIIRTGKEMPTLDGDLMKLYKAATKALNFDVPTKDLNDTIKQILTGLTSITVGLSGLRNKMSDSHAPLYKSSKRHAKLAINTAFTLCEFLLDSLEYQQK